MRKSKYKPEMNQKAYDILAAGGIGQALGQAHQLAQNKVPVIIEGGQRLAGDRVADRLRRRHVSAPPPRPGRHGRRA